jgi:uncharacterized protein (DUF1778 family)
MLAAETLADRRIDLGPRLVDQRAVVPQGAREFSLSAKQYDAFVAALDTPPKSRPRLGRLLRTTS